MLRKQVTGLQGLPIRILDLVQTDPVRPAVGCLAPEAEPISAKSRAFAVCEFGFYVLLLLLSKQINIGRIWRITHPRVAQNFADSESGFGIRVEEALEEVAGFQRYIILQLIISLHDYLLQLTHIIGLKRHRPIKHCKQHNATAPNIDCKPIVSLVPQYLGSDVGRRATLLSHFLTLFDNFTDTKVADFDHARRIQQNIVKFDVPMQDALSVAVGEAFYYLLKQALRHILLQPPTPPHIVQQISASAHLYHK